jgi:hypothetical protein
MVHPKKARGTAAMVAGALAFLSLTACADSDFDPFQAEENAQEGPEETVDPVAPAGEIASGDGVDIQVFGNWRTREVPVKAERKPLVPLDGSDFVVVDLAIINRSDHPLDVICQHDVDVQLVDDAGAKYAPIKRMYDVQTAADLCNEPQNPGATMRTQWVFDVPAGSSVSSVSAALWSGGKLVGEPALSRLKPFPGEEERPAPASPEGADAPAPIDEPEPVEEDDQAPA